MDVHRATSSTLEASGKGVNVSRALAKVGVPTCAVLPAGGPTGRYLAGLLEDEGVASSDSAGRWTRVNTTALRPGGVTVKLNGPGGELSAEEQDSLLNETTLALVGRERRAVLWLAICGSLPPAWQPSWW